MEPTSDSASWKRSIETSPPWRISAVLTLFAIFVATASVAEGPSRAQMRGLDEQVQEIKSDVLAISAELGDLEERLLFPSDTQVSVFVALEDGAEFRLDSLQVVMNGEAVARHIYSFKELEALQKGGVQRIYTGNLPTGGHALEVVYAGKRVNGDDFEGSGRIEFRKDAGPELLGVTIAADTMLTLGAW